MSEQKRIAELEAELVKAGEMLREVADIQPSFKCNWCGEEGFNIVCDVCGNQYCNKNKCWEKHKELHPNG